MPSHATETRPSVPRKPPYRFGDAAITHMFMCMFAAEESGPITVTHLLRSLYVVDLERMLLYWNSWRDWVKIESVMRRFCGLTRPRWVYWLELYESTRRKRKPAFLNKLIPYDAHVAAIFEEAAGLAARYRKGSSEIGFREIFLATTKHQDLTPIGALLATGLDLSRLERDVISGRRLNSRPRT